MSSDQQLNNLRSELDILNLRFMELVDQRFNIVTEIHKIKKENNNAMWSPERELSVFKKYVELTPKADLRFDMMYSLLIEVQASKSNDYPLWSKKIHIENPTNELVDYINPILLFVRDRSKWDSMKYTEEITRKMKGILND